MIYYTTNGYKADLLCRAKKDNERTYIGISETMRANVYFSWDFTELIKELPKPIEALERLIADQTLDRNNKRALISMFRMYCNLNETEQRLTKLVYEMTK